MATHEHVLIETRQFAREAAESGDDGTSDLLVSEVIRLDETQV